MPITCCVIVVRDAGHGAKHFKQNQRQAFSDNQSDGYPGKQGYPVVDARVQNIKNRCHEKHPDKRVYEF